MKANFDACLAHTFGSEGGYANDPHDPGGETNMGISRRSYPKEDIRGMTRERAGAIYRRDFWNPVKGDDLPAGLDLAAFDAAVNSGVSRGAKWVQQALGVTADGKIGPETLAAAGSTYAPAAIQRAVAFRMAFLKGLPTWGRYGKGWTARCERLQETALAMADQNPIKTSPPKPVVPVPAAPARPAWAWWMQALMGIFDQITHKWRH